jgi:hypothetical protein
VILESAVIEESQDVCVPPPGSQKVPPEHWNSGIMCSFCYSTTSFDWLMRASIHLGCFFTFAIPRGFVKAKSHNSFECSEEFESDTNCWYRFEICLTIQVSLLHFVRSQNETFREGFEGAHKIWKLAPVYLKMTMRDIRILSASW